MQERKESKDEVVTLEPASEAELVNVDGGSTLQDIVVTRVRGGIFDSDALGVKVGRGPTP